MASHSSSYKQFSSHLTKMVSKANHRFDRMEKAGWNSPAMETAKKTGGRFHNGRSMTYREMQKEHKRVSNFLNSKTSSKTGTKRSVGKLLNATGLNSQVKTGDVMVNQSLLSKYFAIYKKVQEYDQVKGVGRNYQSTMNAITSTFESTGGGGDPDEILNHVINALDRPIDDGWDSDEVFNHIIG